MGVPGLSKALKPYSVSTTVGCKTAGCIQHQPQHGGQIYMVIDGPSFAYCIYQRVIAAKAEWLTAIEAIPSYDEVGNGAIAFLEVLENYGVEIGNIYFDGYLPLDKRLTRVKRLQKSHKELAKYQKANASLQPSNPTKRWNEQPPTNSTVFEAGPPTTSNTFRGLPPAPFIVPAVLDALKSTKYGLITHVVHGEAETYCALAVRNSGSISIILTNDSDLFLHQLGPQGGFAYLSTTELRPCTEDLNSSQGSKSCEIIKLDVFHPYDIVKRLGIELHQLGFQFSKEPSQTLPQAIEAAKRHQYGQQIDFDRFRSQYTEISIVETEFLTPESITNRAPYPPFLDPRLSELVLQLEHPNNRPVEVYLLSLIEDPSRASAWSISSSQRAFAYSTCALNHADKGIAGGVSECSRKGGNYIMQTITIPSTTQLADYASNLQQEIDSCHQTFSNLLTPLRWRIFAILEVYRWHLDNGKTPPTVEMIRHALNGTSNISWEGIHFEAQIQAFLYSLRMISQALGYAIDTLQGGVLIQQLQEVAATLQSLPPLKLLIPSRHELAEQVADVDVDSVLQRLAEMLNREAGNPK